jgi:hypothetical protein
LNVIKWRAVALGIGGVCINASDSVMKSHLLPIVN